MTSRELSQAIVPVWDGLESEILTAYRADVRLAGICSKYRISRGDLEALVAEVGMASRDEIRQAEATLLTGTPLQDLSTLRAELGVYVREQERNLLQRLMAAPPG
jgi:hypothetical protein